MSYTAGKDKKKYFSLFSGIGSHFFAAKGNEFCLHESQFFHKISHRKPYFYEKKSKFDYTYCLFLAEAGIMWGVFFTTTIGPDM